MQLPPPLQPGDLLEVIAPSGALKEYSTFEQSLEIWRQKGYRIKLNSNYNKIYGYLAGNDQQRRQALAEAWHNPESKGVLCARGGYGSTRLLEDWHWQNTQFPKWLIGFSDVTGLLWSLAKFGISGVHGPVLTTLAQEPQWSIERLFDCVEGRKLSPLQGKGWGGGRVTGRLLPGNLTVATHLLYTSLQPSFEGVILALEDVSEAPYRIDRMLTQWRLSGVLEKVRGIALGRFSHCESTLGVASWTIEEVLSDRLGDLGIPIVADLPFGHDGVNATLPVGTMVELDADRGIINFFE